MNKAYNIGGKWYRQRSKRENHIFPHELYSFGRYLARHHGIRTPEQLDELSLYQVDKLFCQYQIYCCRWEYEAEAASFYGLHGLFG